MKRFMVYALLALLTVLWNIEAYAAFEMGRLIQVVYKKDDVEVATDLLDVTITDFSQQNLQVAPAGTVKLSQFVTTNSWGDLSAGFFAQYADIEAGQAHAWFATTQPIAPAISELSLGGYFGSADNTQSYYASLSSSSTVTGDPTYPNAYWVKMNSRTTPGQYGGYNTGYETAPGSGQYVKHGEAKLSDLETVGYVDMYLYHFDLHQLVPGPLGTPYTAVLRLNSDGSTILNPGEGPNLPPVLKEVRDVTIGTDAAYVVRLTLSQGHSANLVWTVQGPPGMGIDQSGRVSWPQPTEAGSPHPVTVRVENAEGFDETTWMVTVIEGYTPPPDGDIWQKVTEMVGGKTFVTKVGTGLFDVLFSETIATAGCPFGMAELIDCTFGSLGSFPYDTLPGFNVAGLGLRIEGGILVQDIPGVLVLQFASANVFSVHIGNARYQGVVNGPGVTVTGDDGSWDFSCSMNRDEVIIEGVRFKRLFGGLFATAPVLVLEPKD